MYMRKGGNDMTNEAIYEVINKRILERLEEARQNGTKFKWVKGWTGFMTGNVISGKAYRGINALFLDGLYITYKQLCEFQGKHPETEFKIPKGTKQHTVYFFKFNEVEETVDTPNGTEVVRKRIPLLRYYKVFSVNDITNLSSYFLPVKYEHDITEEMLKANKIINDYCKRTGLTFEILEGSDRCYYSPKQHKVCVPPISAFASVYEAYSAYLHELVHSTAKALEREIGKAFGSEEYSFEELVAEIGSQMLLAVLDLEEPECFDNSLAYIQGWESAIKNSGKHFISSAACKAQKAVDFILDQMYEKGTEEVA